MRAVFFIGEGLVVTDLDSYSPLPCSSARGLLLLALTGDLEESEYEFDHSEEVEFIKEQIKRNESCFQTDSLPVAPEAGI